MVVAAAFGMRDAIHLMRVDWKVSEGTVTGGHLKEEQASSSRRKTRVYRPVVTCRYDVGGMTVKREFPSSFATSFKERQQEKLDELLAAGQHPIYYNPADPQDAHLGPPEVGMKWVMVAVPLLAASGLGFAAWRSSFPKAKSKIA